MNYVVNTSTTGTQYQVTVETQDSSATTLDGPTNSFYFSICQNSCHTNTYHIPWSSTVSTTTNYTTKFTTATTTPNNAKFKLTFPTGFNIESVTFSTSSDFDGGFTLSTTSQTIILQRDSQGTTTATGTKYFTLQNITNPSTPSSTYYAILETTDSSDNNIEGPTRIRFSISSAGLGLAVSPWPIFAHDVKHSGRTTTDGPSYPAVKWKYSATSDIHKTCCTITPHMPQFLLK